MDCFFFKLTVLGLSFLMQEPVVCRLNSCSVQASPLGAHKAGPLKTGIMKEGRVSICILPPGPAPLQTSSRDLEIRAVRNQRKERLVHPPCCSPGGCPRTIPLPFPSGSQLCRLQWQNQTSKGENQKKKRISEWNGLNHPLGL